MNPTSATAANPGVILIADDNPEARRMLEVRVKRENYQAILVENGHEALEVLASQPVDVVLLDLEMPELDGYGVLASLKANPQLAHLPVLIISGGGDQEDLVRCIEMGAIDYLPKPFNQAVLRARLAACVAQKRKWDQEHQQQASAPTTAETLSPKLDLSETTQWRRGIGPAGPKLEQAASGQADAAALPERLGRIVLGRVLGSGAMGRVYLGHHELLDLAVAVKVLPPERTATQTARLRLLQEARLVARLAHRHIVRLFEVGEFGSSVYLAFEYVAGGTLAGLLDGQPSRQLPIPAAIRVVAEAAEALAEANRVGITHRDVKPANLLLTPAREVKVGDFGLAKQLASAAADTPQLSMEGTVSGTPLYMAPEQLHLDARLDVRTDLYALGSVLYEMLVGHAPFAHPELLGPPREGERSTSGKDIFYHLARTPPLPPSRFRADVPSWLEGICLKLLAKQPDDRFPTPEMLLANLQGRPHQLAQEKPL